MRRKTARSLWWGTLTLTGAALASRGLGLIYRMLLARFLGSEGLGLFQMIFPLYVSLVTLAVAGIPIALSQMLAEGRSTPHTLMRTASLVVLTVSLPLSIMVVLWAKPLALALYHDIQFVPLLWALSPALVAVALTSVLRGYFIGRQQMAMPAASQVAEQLFRVAILYALINTIGHQSFPNAPLIAVILIPLGETISLLILAAAYWRYRDPAEHPPHPNRGIVRSLLRLALPITANRLIGSAIGVVEATMIPTRLMQSGLSGPQAIRLFGQITGMALPLIFFPTALTLSLSTNLVPAIAEAYAQNDYRTVERHVIDSIKATAFLTIPITLTLLLIGTPLDDLFFHASVPTTVFLPLVLGGFFLYFDITLSGILRGLGRTDIPLRHDIFASLLEVALIWVTAPIRGHGPAGVAWSLAVGFFVSFLLNWTVTTRLTRVRWPWAAIIGKPVVASAPLAFAIPLCELWAHAHHLSPLPSLALGIAVASVLYAMMLWLTGSRFSRLI